jgi:amino acid transporter
MSIRSTSQLDKVINASQLFTLSFGTIIGVGWVVVLGLWLEEAGPLGAILGFVGGGLVILLVGLCYAEMATTFPVSGGEIAYAYELFGLKPCFLIGWFLALAYIGVSSYEAIALGWVTGALFPGIDGITLYTIQGEQVSLGSLLLGLGGMIIITFLNYRGVRAAARFQDIGTYGLLFFSLIFITVGLSKGHSSNLVPLFQHGPSGPSVGGIIAVFITAPFWFAGFNVIPQVMGEKAPRTPLTRVGHVILVSILVATSFYCLVILSASMTLPWQQLITLELPAASAFKHAFGSSALRNIVLVAALMGILTTWNAIFIASSRVLFTLGRARVVPGWFGYVHPVFRSPVVAILFAGIIGSLGTLLGRPGIVLVINVGSTCFVLAYLLTCLAVIRSRRKFPDKARPFRVPGGGATATLAAISCVFMLVVSFYQPWMNAKGAFPREWAVFLGWSLLGVLFWLLAGKIRRQVKEHERRDLILESG